MDYVVGSVAALISGNVTPNRPKLVRRALTPIKHQQSPNVTPKSEFVDDRSIFMSPTLQKKKAIVKKSPKRIFENPDLDVTSENENGSNPSSPKADKVKKHLNKDLAVDDSVTKSPNASKSPKKPNKLSPSPTLESPQSANENTPKKLKRKSNTSESNKTSENDTQVIDKPSKKNKRNSESFDSGVNEAEEISNVKSPKKKKKKNKTQQGTDSSQSVSTETAPESVIVAKENVKSAKKKNKKRKNKSKNNPNQVKEDESHQIKQDKSNHIKQEIKTVVPAETKATKSKKKKNKNENYVNPNAVTNKDSDSEHESDDELVSENEEANKEVLDTGPVEESSDEEEATPNPKKPENKEKSEEPRSEDEIKRTLFVGNVPFSKKIKKEIKKIFSQYGDIETVRIRTVPVKDARVTPKLAVIKSELHPERTTVNVYVKFKEQASVQKALAENNTVLNNCHLRVSPSESTGAEHDPRCSVFVGNVPFAIEDETLREKFEKCGDIESVRVIRDKKTNAGKGFAYINFASKDGVELALALSEEDLTIKNRILRVKRCTNLTHKQKNQESAKGKNFQGKNQFSKNVQNRNQGGRNFQKNQFGKKGGSFNQRQGQNESVGEGAARRLMHKRKNQDGGEGPPEKRQKNINQPQREKKTRKEFVGMTAEKKGKKPTFTKGQKKKKALSEILTKYS